PRVSTRRRARRCRRDRPCRDLKSKEGLFAAGRIGSIMVFPPGGRFFTAGAPVASSLPNAMVRAIGLPRSTSSALEHLQLIQEERATRSAHELRLFLSLLFICVTLTCSARLRSSTQCCPPNISSITIDHDELFELPIAKGRRVA